MVKFAVGVLIGALLGGFGLDLYIQNMGLSGFMDHVVEMCPEDMKTVVAERDGDWTITCRPPAR